MLSFLNPKSSREWKTKLEDPCWCCFSITSPASFTSPTTHHPPTWWERGGWSGADRRKGGEKELTTCFFFPSFWCVIQAATSRRSTPPQDYHILHVYFARHLKAAEGVGIFFLKRLPGIRFKASVSAQQCLDVVQSAVGVHRMAWKQIDHADLFANLN